MVWLGHVKTLFLVFGEVSILISTPVGIKVPLSPHILVRGELVFIIICFLDYSHSNWGDLHFSVAREMLWAFRKHLFVIFISVLIVICSDYWPICFLEVGV